MIRYTYATCFHRSGFGICQFWQSIHLHLSEQFVAKVLLYTQQRGSLLIRQENNRSSITMMKSLMLVCEVFLTTINLPNYRYEFIKLCVIANSFAFIYGRNQNC